MGIGAGGDGIRVFLLSAQQESLARAFARQIPSIPILTTEKKDGPATTSGTTGDEPQFPEKLFRALETTSIGYLNCTMIKSMNLHALAATSPPSTPSTASLATITTAVPNAETAGLGSELFIVRVDNVVMNEDVIEGKDGKGGSLVYWDHQYRTVGIQEE